MLQILDLLSGLFEHKIEERKLQHDFPKLRGGQWSLEYSAGNTEKFKLFINFCVGTNACCVFK